jgi:hypothetical protein
MRKVARDATCPIPTRFVSADIQPMTCLNSPLTVLFLVAGVADHWGALTGLLTLLEDGKWYQ